MDNVIRAIRVRDANGDELILYEYELMQPIVMGPEQGQTTRLALDTGEEAMRLDDGSFFLVTSGERLPPIG